MPTPKRYQHIDFQPPQTVADEAARGLELRELHGRGGTEVGYNRAQELKARKVLTPGTVRKMRAYFARHNVDKRGKNWGDKDKPSAGYIAWLLWGGEPGRAWAEKVVAQVEAADAKD